MKMTISVVLLFTVGMILGACAAAPVPQSAALPAQAASAAINRLTADQLDRMLAGPKDFTLVNVHVPYEGELAKTDLQIPYDQVDAHLTQLPNKDAKIVLYCRSGRMSDIAARRLVELGYTHIYDLTGGMVAWEASGRSLVQR
jgi:rhodanese-related sulfurtransferase